MMSAGNGAAIGAIVMIAFYAIVTVARARYLVGGLRKISAYIRAKKRYKLQKAAYLAALVKRGESPLADVARKMRNEQKATPEE